MVGQQSEMEAGTPDGLCDTRAESWRKGGEKGGFLWVSDRRRAGAGGLCKGPGVSQHVPDFGAVRLAS